MFFLKFKHFNLFFSFAIMLMLAGAIQVMADTPAIPNDYKKLTENKQYVFVMLTSSDWAEKDKALRLIYKQSGLYLNDGSGVSLWTVDWYASDVIPSSDGQHLVRFGPWASSGYQLAVAFYNNGHEIKRYKVMDLVRDEKKLTYTASHFFWRKEEKYDDKLATLFVTTQDGQEYLISTKTGEIINK